MAVSQNLIFHSLKVEGPGVLDLFEISADFFLCQNVFQRNS